MPLMGFGRVFSAIVTSFLKRCCDSASLYWLLFSADSLLGFAMSVPSTKWPFHYPNVRLEPMKFRPAGRCIYCGATEYEKGDCRPLADEHIVPLALNGIHVLPEASCRTCERITGGIEQRVLRGDMHMARHHFKFSRRRRKAKPTAEIYLSCPEQKAFIRTSLPVEQCPAVLTFYFPATKAGRLLAKEPGYSPGLIVEQIVLNPEVASKLGDYVIAVDCFSFFRMIAKIAHAFAMANWSDFEPTLVPLILGTSDDFLYYIGQAGPSLCPYIEDDLCMLRTYPIKYNNKVLAMVDIGMFMSRGGPLYQIVAGEVSIPKRRT